MHPPKEFEARKRENGLSRDLAQKMLFGIFQDGVNAQFKVGKISQQEYLGKRFELELSQYRIHRERAVEADRLATQQFIRYRWRSVHR